jgi:hypothetical protein
MTAVPIAHPTPNFGSPASFSDVRLPKFAARAR